MTTKNRNYTLEEMRSEEREEALAIVDRGIRSGDDLRTVRKVAGVRAVDLAVMLDVAPETVSRWESNKLPIPRLVAFAVAELFEHPKAARKKLEMLATSTAG